MMDEWDARPVQVRFEWDQDGAKRWQAVRLHTVPAEGALVEISGRGLFRVASVRWVINPGYPDDVHVYVSLAPNTSTHDGDG